MYISQVNFRTDKKQVLVCGQQNLKITHLIYVACVSYIKIAKHSYQLRPLHYGSDLIPVYGLHFISFHKRSRNTHQTLTRITPTMALKLSKQD